MRQLKGKPAKESRKQKRERRKNNIRGQELGLKYALPAIMFALFLLAIFIYNATH